MEISSNDLEISSNAHKDLEISVNASHSFKYLKISLNIWRYLQIFKDISKCYHLEISLNYLEISLNRSLVYLEISLNRLDDIVNAPVFKDISKSFGDISK